MIKVKRVKNLILEIKLIIYLIYNFIQIVVVESSINRRRIFLIIIVLKFYIQIL